MSSSDNGQKGIIDMATDIGDRVYAQAYREVGRRLSPAALRSATGGPALANKCPANLVDLAQDVAALALHTAGQIGEVLVQAAGELESVVARHPPGRPGTQAPTTAASAGLVLPEASPGHTTSASFQVRNDSPGTVDAMHFRCGALFGPGDERIAGTRVKFFPLTMDVAPMGVAAATCTVDVPSQAKRTHYVGLIEASGLPGVQLLVSLNVI